MPAGSGADEKSAEYRQARIRAIEYKCKANSVYETAYQHMLEGSYGYWRISRKWTSTDPENWEQEITITSIPNPDSVLYDPGAKEPDWSDAKWAFVLEPMSREQFRRQWPDAKATDYTSFDHDTAPRWIDEKNVLVCEYWRVETETKRQTRTSPRTGKKQTRTVECKHVKQFFSNGLEILEKNEQPGTEIPIPACVGLERYLPKASGDGSERIIFSLVRLARDPQMFLAYLLSQEAEVAGLIPKAPYIGYTGQFESDKDAWRTVTKLPHPFLQVDPIPDSANGQILPPPRRESFEADFQSWELAKEATRRAIMAAMGISPLPTAAMRASEKSGVAIQRIQQEQALGSFHFVDNFERAIARCGRIIESWLPEYDEAEKDVTLCFEDDTRRIVRINTPEPVVNPQTGEPEHYLVEEGEHDVTVSVGPSNQSQRDAASDSINALIPNLPALGFPPAMNAQLLAKSIDMMQLGPIGDQMVEILVPPDQQNIPPQAQAQIAQAQGAMQQQAAAIQDLSAQVQQLTYEKQARIVDNQGRLEIEKLKASFDLLEQRLKAESQLAVAQINTANQEAKQRMEAIHLLVKSMHDAADQRGAMAAQHAHELRMHDEESMVAERLADKAAAAAEKAAEKTAAKKAKEE